MNWLAAIAAVALAALYLRERSRRRTAQWETATAEQNADRFAAALEGARLSASEARGERDKALADLAGARRELETARLDQQQRARANGDALAAAGRGRVEAAARLKRIEEIVHEARDFLDP